jgi:hypothetical protein
MTVHHTSWPCGMAGARDTETAEWTAVTCPGCRLEQPAQKVPGRVEYEIPAEVQHVDALLAAADRRERAGRKVVKWTARLEAALAEERRLTDAPVQLWPAPAEVTYPKPMPY